MVVVVVQREPQLSDAVGAGCPPTGFAGRLHCGQQKADERADDRHDNEQFDQREAGQMSG
jgi:hypothetical protein